jgi:hypothetical protein
VSVAKRVSGPDLPERADQVRAALADADLARFDAELDQALDAARQTHDLKPMVARWRITQAPLFNSLVAELPDETRRALADVHRALRSTMTAEPWSWSA